MFRFAQHDRKRETHYTLKSQSKTALIDQSEENTYKPMRQRMGNKDTMKAKVLEVREDVNAEP